MFFIPTQLYSRQAWARGPGLLSPSQFPLVGGSSTPSAGVQEHGALTVPAPASLRVEVPCYEGTAEKTRGFYPSSVCKCHSQSGGVTPGKEGPFSSSSAEEQGFCPGESQAIKQELYTGLDGTDLFGTGLEVLSSVSPQSPEDQARC